MEQLGTPKRPRATALRTGLVLGAGGAMGHAFHVSVLAALEDELGIHARDVDVVVGTSAGSIVGTLLRAGVTPHELVAMADVSLPTATSTDHAPSRPAMGKVLRSAGPAPRFPAPSPLRPGQPHVSARELMGRMVGGPRISALTALGALLPRGTSEFHAHAAWLDRLVKGRWTDDPLWVCSVELPSLQRVVWGRDPKLDPSIGNAVAASCSVPGYATPLTHGDGEYVDGGLISPTSADVLEHEGLDLAIVISPMSSERGSGGLRPDRFLRGFWRRMLAREVATLRRAGTEVIVIEPSAQDLQMMHWNMLADRASAGSIERTYDGVRRRLRDEHSGGLAALRSIVG